MYGERCMGVVPRRNAVALARHTVASDLGAEELQGWAQEAAKSQSAPTCAIVGCSPANSQNPLCTHLLYSFTVLLLCLHITTVTWASHVWTGQLAKFVLAQGINPRHTKNGCWHPGSGMKALMCPTAECCVPSKYGMDVSCCLASCSSITRGNHLSTSGLPEELKLSQPGASFLLWGVSDERCCLSCATSNSPHLLILRETLLTSSLPHPTDTSGHTWKYCNIMVNTWLSMAVLFLERPSSCWPSFGNLGLDAKESTSLQTHQELKMGDSTFPNPARLHHPTPMVLSPALSHSREASSQYRGVCKILVVRKKKWNEQEETLSKCSKSFFH